MTVKSAVLAAWKWFISLRWWGKTLIILGLFVIFIGIVSEPLPSLTITTPNKTITETTSTEAVITGTAPDPNTTVKVGDRSLELDSEGNFSYYTDLEMGRNKFEISASRPGENGMVENTKTIYITREPTEEERAAQMETEKAAEAEKQRQKEIDRKGDVAAVCAQNEIKNLLRSPSTAKFPGKLSSVHVSDDDYIVADYVDAQNAFGANIRNNYICEVTVLDAQNFLCKTSCAFE